MKTLKLTHYFDVVKKETVCGDDLNNLSSINVDNALKQEYHYKEELDIAWDERDNDYETHQKNLDFSSVSISKSEYPTVLIERLPDKVINKYVFTDKNERLNGTSDTTKSNKMRKKHYFACSKCDYKSISKFGVNQHLNNVHPNLQSLNRKVESVQSDIISMIKILKCSKCKKQFQRLSTLLKHFQVCGQTKRTVQSKHSPTINVQDKCIHHCIKCNKSVKNDKIGSFHDKKCQSCHSKYSFQCKQCKQIFKSYGGINQHLNVSHIVRKNDLKCPECDYKTFYIEYLTKHVRRTHFIEIHVCPKCDGKYKNRSLFKTHTESCNKEPEYQCDHCSHKTKRKQCLRQHILRVHTKGNDIKCPQCSIILKNKACLKTHSTYCKKLPHLECNICSFKTKFKYCFYNHYKNKHSEVQKKEKCPYCAKEYKNKQSLYSHLKLCGKFPDSSCSYCFRKYKNKYSLKKHIIRIHSKDDSVYDKLPYLNCNDCTYKTKFKSDLVKHVIIHLDDNQIECPKCKKLYKREYFKRHMVYCGKEPLKCNLCNFKTFCRGSIRVHIQNVHSVGNEIECPKCSRTCKNKKYLIDHLKRCGTDPHLQCDYCSYKTKYKYILKKHIEKNHLKLKIRRRRNVKNKNE